jgi:hypothetical protein
VGDSIGTMFVGPANRDAMRHHANLPDRDHAQFEESSGYFATTRALIQEQMRSDIAEVVANIA